VPVAVAARLLGVSEPTVRDWADQGVLEDAPVKPRALSLESVVRVRERLQRLRALGKSKDLRSALLVRIDDAITLKEPRVVRSLRQMRAGTHKHYVR
jgi:hypothetical protein